MFEPDNGKPIPNDKKTEVKIYDNNAIYISALLYDNEPDKKKEITNRDVLEYQITFRFTSMGLMMANKTFVFCKCSRSANGLFNRGL
jgi:hypothetical protein